MIKVFVSGCYDILHAGHIQFFKDAKALGNHLTVCFASNSVLWKYKKRKASLPDDNKEILLKNLKDVDDVVKSSNEDPIFDFSDHFDRIKPDILVITEDDQYKQEKSEFCQNRKVKLVILPKTNNASIVSTTSILNSVKNDSSVPLRIDFAGGWLDVPSHSIDNGYIVNCAIQPFVDLDHWGYEIGSGLGSSAAKAILDGKDAIISELQFGAGWQDPAIIIETGLCVWKSGKKPILEIKTNPDWLKGRMLIHWLGKSHNTSNIVNINRNYRKIFEASIVARQAVLNKDFNLLCRAVNLSYDIQKHEGMNELPDLKAKAMKYLGSGFGGYALYLFKDQMKRDVMCQTINQTKIIEPYMKQFYS